MGRDQWDQCDCQRRDNGQWEQWDELAGRQRLRRDDLHQHLFPLRGRNQANGAGHEVGGGGGRIAVRSSSFFSFPDSNLKASGGTGNYDSGGHGTVYVRRPGQAYGDLIVDGQGSNAPNDTTPILGDLTFDNITLKNGADVIANGKLTATGTLLVTGNSRLAANGGLVVNESRENFGCKRADAQPGF